MTVTPQNPFMSDTLIMMIVDFYPHNPRNNQDQGARDPAFSRETNLNIEHFQGDQPEHQIIINIIIFVIIVIIVFVVIMLITLKANCPL